jgi:NitT/TauT family transport system ATP-binding protein
MSAITLENVSLAFAAKPQPFTVLEDISLSLHKGICGVTGAFRLR